jgi:hypothetical protein
MRAHGIDSQVHIATILGISIDDWDILAPFSGLFDSSNRIQTNTWVRKLQFEVKFEDFYTVSSNDNFKTLSTKDDIYRWLAKN